VTLAFVGSFPEELSSNCGSMKDCRLLVQNKKETSNATGQQQLFFLNMVLKAFHNKLYSYFIVKVSLFSENYKLMKSTRDYMTRKSKQT
jgi:hypothetical protein